MRDDPRLEQCRAIPIGDIADQLGLELKRVTSTERAGGCPSCGSSGPHSDRFAINTARNVFNCRKCGAAGDQLALVQLALGCDFKSALAHLAGERDVSLDPEEADRRRKKAAAARAQNEKIEAEFRARAVKDAREIWARAEGGDLDAVEAYLEGRGIRFDRWPPTLRCIVDHPYRRKIKGNWHELHRGPCMIAAVQDAQGRVRAVHQTWIDPSKPGHKAAIADPKGEPMPSKLVRGSKKGGAIRLTSAPGPGGVLVMGEGIETTASLLMVDAYPGASFWAGVDLGNLAGLQVKEDGKRGHSGIPKMDDPDAFVPPAHIGRLVFLEDGDSAQPATRLQLLSGLRRAMALQPNLQTEIVTAPEGKDFNDLIKGD